MRDLLTAPEGVALRPRTETEGRASAFKVAPGVQGLRLVFVNAYLVGSPGGPWFLLDTGLRGRASVLRKAAAERYGPTSKPEAIVLTHGHFDHAGCAIALADHWGVPIYAHRAERPFLTGQSDYPPPDPTVGGALAEMSRLFPKAGYDLGARLQDLPDDGTVPGAAGWRWLHTPGHTPGHISLFRDHDRVLLAGDALATVNQESGLKMLITLERELRRPPAAMTPDWQSARGSLRRLAELNPATIAAGHGLAMSEPDLPERFRAFAYGLDAPRYGRYVNEPALADARGVYQIPPAVPDKMRTRALVGAAGLAGGILLVKALRDLRKNS